MRKVKKIENTKINENIKQIMLYLIVGSGATIVEWIVFFLLDHYLNIHYMIATSLAFVLSTFANWVLGRLIMFKECLKYNIVPFIIEDNRKMFYYRGLKEWNNEKGYLTDTCLTAQDKYKVYLDYFRIAYEWVLMRALWLRLLIDFVVFRKQQYIVLYIFLLLYLVSYARFTTP